MAKQTNESRQHALLCAKLADGKKAEDIVIMEMKKLLYFTDYFIVCTAFNPKHVESVVEELRQKMKKNGVNAIGTEGLDSKTWALVDFGDVVVHVMQKPIRDYYQLEELWADARRVNWRPSAKGRKKIIASPPTSF